jgi:hypothetical protein
MTSEKLIAIRREEPMMPPQLELNVPEEKIWECGHCKHLKHYLAFQGWYNTISSFKCKYLLRDGSCNHYEAIRFRDLLIKHEKKGEEG